MKEAIRLLVRGSGLTGGYALIIFNSITFLDTNAIQQLHAKLLPHSIQ